MKVLLFFTLVVFSSSLVWDEIISVDCSGGVEILPNAPLHISANLGDIKNLTELALDFFLSRAQDRDPTMDMNKLLQMLPFPDFILAMTSSEHYGVADNEPWTDMYQNFYPSFVFSNFMVDNYPTSCSLVDYQNGDACDIELQLPSWGLDVNFHMKRCPTGGIPEISVGLAGAITEYFGKLCVDSSDCGSFQCLDLFDPDSIIFNDFLTMIHDDLMVGTEGMLSECGDITNDMFGFSSCTAHPNYFEPLLAWFQNHYSSNLIPGAFKFCSFNNNDILNFPLEYFINDVFTNTQITDPPVIESLGHPYTLDASDLTAFGNDWQVVGTEKTPAMLYEKGFMSNTPQYVPFPDFDNYQEENFEITNLGDGYKYVFDQTYNFTNHIVRLEFGFHCNYPDYLLTGYPIGERVEGPKFTLEQDGNEVLTGQCIFYPPMDNCEAITRFEWNGEYFEDESVWCCPGAATCVEPFNDIWGRIDEYIPQFKIFQDWDDEEGILISSRYQDATGFDAVMVTGVAIAGYKTWKNPGINIQAACNEISCGWWGWETPPTPIGTPSTTYAVRDVFPVLYLRNMAPTYDATPLSYTRTINKMGTLQTIYLSIHCQYTGDGNITGSFHFDNAVGTFLTIDCVNINKQPCYDTECHNVLISINNNNVTEIPTRSYYHENNWCIGCVFQINMYVVVDHLNEKLWVDEMEHDFDKDSDQYDVTYPGYYVYDFLVSGASAGITQAKIILPNGSDQIIIRHFRIMNTPCNNDFCDSWNNRRDTKVNRLSHANFNFFTTTLTDSFTNIVPSLTAAVSSNHLIREIFKLQSDATIRISLNEHVNFAIRLDFLPGIINAFEDTLSNWADCICDEMSVPHLLPDQKNHRLYPHLLEFWALRLQTPEVLPQPDLGPFFGDFSCAVNFTFMREIGIELPQTSCGWNALATGGYCQIKVNFTHEIIPDTNVIIRYDHNPNHLGLFGISVSVQSTLVKSITDFQECSIDADCPSKLACINFDTQLIPQEVEYGEGLSSREFDPFSFVLWDTIAEVDNGVLSRDKFVCDIRETVRMIDFDQTLSAPDCAISYCFFNMSDFNITDLLEDMKWDTYFPLYAPVRVDFGTWIVGTNFSQNIQFENLGNEIVYVDANPTLDEDLDHFTIFDFTVDNELLIGEEYIVEINFSPEWTGVFDSYLEVKYHDWRPDQNTIVQLHGIGVVNTTLSPAPVVTSSMYVFTLFASLAIALRLLF